MCIWFEVTPLHGSPEEVDNATQMAAIAGCEVSDLPTNSGSPMHDNDCLCDFDAEAFGKKFGFRLEEGETTFDHYLVQEARP
ncbi:hypothetical protein D3C76_571710 [compost metagenome]